MKILCVFGLVAVMGCKLDTAPITDHTPPVAPPVQVQAGYAAPSPVQVQAGVGGSETPTSEAGMGGGTSVVVAGSGGSGSTTGGAGSMAQAGTGGVAGMGEPIPPSTSGGMPAPIPVSGWESIAVDPTQVSIPRVVQLQKLTFRATFGQRCRVDRRTSLC